MALVLRCIRSRLPILVAARHASGGPELGRFSGKRAIVTGGASGIGYACARRLGLDGATVAVFDINKEAGVKAVQQLRSEGSDAHFYECDVSEKSTCAEQTEAFAKAEGEGKVHFLISNAVYFGSQALKATDKDWSKSMAVNVVGASNMVQSCHPFMLAAGGRGCSIVLLASVSAHRAQPVRWTYSATKGALHIMAKTMALDLSADSIRVNSISPAWIWTPEVSKAAQGDRKTWEPVWGEPFHMVRRFGEASEVASAAAFLLSDDASFITATDLPVDGGYMAMGPEGLGEKSKFAGSDEE
ncbi:cyclopentanol dehydrogenase-like [Sycon ciliatum]|uniref:cyclopentanol dehydrogenase-like n=1 Tax=Sycon ciliatum TaxID=27933 RepID=UPI0031F63E28